MNDAIEPLPPGGGRLPKVVIVGRTNVGKSSLFNRVIRKRLAIVSDREGVTRDLHFQNAVWNGKSFELIDTGGFMGKEKETIDAKVRALVQTALADASVVLFLVDGKSGMTDLDLQFAKLVKRLKTPKILVVNKTEAKEAQLNVPEFWRLGMGEPYAISALNGYGVAEVLDTVTDNIEKVSGEPNRAPGQLHVALLGRPNAGKSTLMNQILGEDKVLVSEIPGTTRDAIDSEIQYRGEDIVFTDTAGLRKKARVEDEVEYYSGLRTHEAIRRSQVCVLLLDANRGLEVQDLKIAGMIEEAGKGLIFALNKWDLIEAEDKTYDHTVKAIYKRAPDLHWVPVVSLSALTGKRVTRLLDLLLEVGGRLNQVLGRDAVVEYFRKAVTNHPHPNTTKGPVKLEKCCQVAVSPPCLAIQALHAERILPGYVRYLKRTAYETFELGGAPLKVYFRKYLKLRPDEELLEAAQLFWNPREKIRES